MVRIDNLQPYDGVDSLDVLGLRNHMIDAHTGDEYMLVEEPSIYPENPPRSLVEILLGKIGMGVYGGKVVQIYKLPDDYVSMAAVLNDVASSQSDRAEEFAYGVFKEIGHSLKKIHDEAKLLPVELAYTDIIVERDVASFKLLPPVEFIVSKELSTIRGLGEVMLQDLRDNAGNEPRFTIIERAFDGFWSELTTKD